MGYIAWFAAIKERCHVNTRHFYVMVLNRIVRRSPFKSKTGVYISTEDKIHLERSKSSPCGLRDGVLCMYMVPCHSCEPATEDQDSMSLSPSLASKRKMSTKRIFPRNHRRFYNWHYVGHLIQHSGRDFETCIAHSLGKHAIILGTGYLFALT